MKEKRKSARRDVVKNYKEIRRQAGYMPDVFLMRFVRRRESHFCHAFQYHYPGELRIGKGYLQQIEPFKHRRAEYPAAMKQKSCALIHRPSILNEPTTGVDPVSRKEFWDMLLKLKQEGLTHHCGKFT